MEEGDVIVSVKISKEDEKTILEIAKKLGKTWGVAAGMIVNQALDLMESDKDFRAKVIRLLKKPKKGRKK